MARRNIQIESLRKMVAGSGVMSKRNFGVRTKSVSPPNITQWRRGVFQSRGGGHQKGHFLGKRAPKKGNIKTNDIGIYPYIV